MKIPTKATMQRVEVEWLDSASTAGWHDAAELAAEFADQSDGGLARCRSLGYLWRVGRHDIVLALNQQPSKIPPHGPWRVGQMMSIARSTILSVHELQLLERVVRHRIHPRRRRRP